MTLLTFSLLVCLCVGLAYVRAPLWIWTAAGALLLATLTVTAAPGPLTLTIAWTLYAVLGLVFNLRPLRRVLVTRHVLRAFRRLLPRMSDTEREAIDAGTVWWDGELFSGRPDWQRLLSAPAPRLSEEEQSFLDGPVEALCAMLDDWVITQELQDLPPEVWRFIKEKGFFGMIIPERYGGLGFSALAHSEVVTKLTTRSGSAAVTVMVPNSLGPAELLLHYGTEAQKDHYLPRLASGEDIPCFALTGPEAGSDASAIPDLGVVCRADVGGESDALAIRLNWNKRYITLAPVATLLGLAFKLEDPDGLLGGARHRGITVALIPTDTPGITIGNRHLPMNQAFLNGPTRGEDVLIPVDWIIGGAEMAGQGWRMLMESLAAGRSISLPALATGSGKVASRATGAYAGIRRQFRIPIGQFEGVQEALARIGGNTYVMDAARTMTLMALDEGEKPAVVSAIVKYQLTERMRQVLNDAMDIHGGRGICMGPRNYLARGYQGVPVAITVEGANILTRSLIVFGQGAIRCHPYIFTEMQAAADDDRRQGLRDFDTALFSHVGFALSNVARNLVFGLTGARWVRTPGTGIVAHYYRQLTRTSAALALCADVVMMSLGGRLKRLERLSARLGDVLSYLYLASAALKRFEDQGRQDADRPLLHWACRESLYRSQIAFDELFKNLPSRWLAIFLRALVFPLGMRYDSPNDANDRRVARLMMRPGPARDRLTEGIYIGTEHDPIGRVEHALVMAVGVESVMRRVQRAVRSGLIEAETPDGQIEEALARTIIDEGEAARLRAADAARYQAITVDDFPPRAFERRNAGPVESDSGPDTPQGRISA
jgi:acyl-CoA dehydrogenase